MDECIYCEKNKVRVGQTDQRQATEQERCHLGRSIPPGEAAGRYRKPPSPRRTVPSRVPRVATSHRIGTKSTAWRRGRSLNGSPRIPPRICPALRSPLAPLAARSGRSTRRCQHRRCCSTTGMDPVVAAVASGCFPGGRGSVAERYHSTGCSALCPRQRPAVLYGGRS